MGLAAFTHTATAAAESAVAADRGGLEALEWWRLVLDEAQAVSDHYTVTSQFLNGLDRVHSWCVTGTPINNNLGDMHDNGEGGLAVDKAKALAWYRKAAEQDNAAVLIGISTTFELSHEHPKATEALAVMIVTIMWFMAEIVPISIVSLMPLPQPADCLSTNTSADQMRKYCLCR